MSLARGGEQLVHAMGDAASGSASASETARSHPHAYADGDVDVDADGNGNGDGDGRPVTRIACFRFWVGVDGKEKGRRTRACEYLFFFFFFFFFLVFFAWLVLFLWSFCLSVFLSFSPLCSFLFSKGGGFAFHSFPCSSSTRTAQAEAQHTEARFPPPCLGAAGHTDERTDGS
jgi:hypothetical protein